MQTQSPTPISKWVIDWADAKAAIRSRAGDLPQIAELDRLISELLDVMLTGADSLQATEAELAAEDELWDTTTAQHTDKLAALAAKIEAAPTLPMFDAQGRWAVDDYPVSAQ